MKYKLFTTIIVLLFSVTVLGQSTIGTGDPKVPVDRMLALSHSVNLLDENNDIVDLDQLSLEEILLLRGALEEVISKKKSTNPTEASSSRNNREF